MGDLQNEFIRQSITDLHSLAEKSRVFENEFLPESLLREIFRVLHTIKGTSQVFGLIASADLAHALENIVAAAKTDAFSAADSKLLAPEGVEILAGTLAGKSFQTPFLFAQKIEKFQSKTFPPSVPNVHLPGFPEEFYAPLSVQEKSSLSEALKSNKNIVVVEIGFETVKFAAEFKDFRASLAGKGEIIAALPSRNFDAPKTIGFQIVYASDEEIEKIIGDSTAEIIYRKRAVSFETLSDVLAQIAVYGKTLAQSFDKTVEFEIFVAAETPSSNLKIIFDAVVHLVRNSISHAFNKTGKITIRAQMAENDLQLSVADDGKGLNINKIRRAAIEKNLVSGDRVLTDAELTNLIFAPDFSTADEISAVSGRGVGLDAVKNVVENAGGRISVESKPDAGTTFEIFLPVKVEKKYI